MQRPPRKSAGHAAPSGLALPPAREHLRGSWVPNHAEPATSAAAPSLAPAARLSPGVRAQGLDDSSGFTVNSSPRSFPRPSRGTCCPPTSTSLLARHPSPAHTPLAVTALTGQDRQEKPSPAASGPPTRAPRRLRTPVAAGALALARSRGRAAGTQAERPPGLCAGQAVALWLLPRALRTRAGGLLPSSSSWEQRGARQGVLRLLGQRSGTSQGAFAEATHVDAPRGMVSAQIVWPRSVTHARLKTDSGRC
uniref:Uncharacterized protein n=1 Tax=Pipistrellus kuhlii TaxID=59472 RepID=A0A7J7WDA5_PIPKU|nr:hypothetical protein mPipKuh1_008098 [Pipistrellus kuhlii]